MNAIWKPTVEWIERTNVWRFMQRLGFDDREAFLRFSVDDPERFWAEMMREMNVQWFEPYRQVMDTSRGPEWAQWFLGGRLNIAQNCVDRWKDSGRIACIWEGESGETRSIGFDQLHAESNRVANGLVARGLRAGDRVAICMPMVPEILSILYGCLKAGIIVTPVFAGFGAGAIATRIEDSGARLAFTTAHITRRGKRLPLAEKMPRSMANIVVNSASWDEFIAGQPESFDTAALDSEHRALLLYTSGTTGKPKGVVHTHAGCLAQMGKEIWLGFDHQANDRFFWLSDLGWMMGPWTILGNHLFGGTIFLYDGAPDYPSPQRLWEMIARHGITTFGVSPTAIRILIKDDEPLPAMPSLRLLGSTGEPWDERSWRLYFERVGGGRCPIINISGGTEIVGSFLFPLPIQELKPCTLGAPAPGMATEVVDENGRPVRGRMGYLVCTRPAPSMTRGIWNDAQRYIETYWSRFPGMWYHGDWASVDEDGHWFLHGRADESMNVAGRKVGPAEVEQAMLRHPGVTEAAVIGVPDEVKGEAIVGYAVPQPGASLESSSICATVVKELGPTLRPREVIVIAELPKTQSGKILRRLLRERYLGSINESLRALLANIIDFAGLYPPAALPLADVLSKYRAYLASPDAWMLNRLVLPVDKLPAVELGDNWRVTLLVENEPGGLPRQVETLERKSGRRLSLPTYCEVPLDQLEDGYGKVRTTNLSSEALADYLCTAAARRVPFKATAGLHHPVRSASMHGFLNVFAGATFAYFGMDRRSVKKLLDETDPHAFEFRNDGLLWRGTCLSTEQVRQARHEFAHSFGSCSFEEPVNDLRALGLLKCN